MKLDETINLVSTLFSQAVLKMRIKLSFSRDGMTIQDQDEVKNLPSALWQ